MYKPPSFLEEEIDRVRGRSDEAAEAAGAHRATVLLRDLDHQKQELTTNYASMRRIFFYFDFFEGHVWQHMDALFASEGAPPVSPDDAVGKPIMAATSETWKIVLRRALVVNQSDWNCSVGVFYYAFRCVYYLFHSRLFQSVVASVDAPPSKTPLAQFLGDLFECTVSFLVHVLQQINTLAQTRSVTSLSFAPLKNTFFDVQQVIGRVEELVYFFYTCTDAGGAAAAVGQTQAHTTLVFILSQEVKMQVSHLQGMLVSIRETMEFMLDRYTTRTVDELLLAEYKCVDFTKGSNLATVKGFHPCVWAYFRLCCAHIRTFCAFTIYPQGRVHLGPDGESGARTVLESSVLSRLLGLTSSKMAIGLMQLIQANHTAASAMKKERREQLMKDVLGFVLLARALRRLFFYERGCVSETFRLLLRAAIQLGPLQDEDKNAGAAAPTSSSAVGDSLWNVQPLTLEKILFLPLYRTATPWASPFFLNSALAPFLSADAGANSLASLAAEARHGDSEGYVALVRTLRSTASSATQVSISTAALAV